MKTNGKRWLGTIVLAGLVTLTAACGNGSTGNTNNASVNSGNTQTTAPTEAAQTTEPAAAEDEGTLTVYLNDFDSIIAPLFEEATGYKLEVVAGNGAEIMSRVEAEKGNPHWDVLWLDAMPSIYGLGASGQLLEGWLPSNAANLTDFSKGFVPEKQWYMPTGAHAAGVIVYNKDKVKAEDAPKTWEDFSNANYKNMIGMADPAIAAPAYPFVSWFFNQKEIDGAQTFFSSLMDNGLRVYPKNPNVVKALAAGEISIAALQESNAYSMKNNGEPIEIIWPAEGAPASVRVAAIQKDTKNPNAAKAFIEFLLDPKTQQALIDQGDESYFQPSVNGVNAKADREADAKLVAADASWASENEAAIKQWFADQSVK
ncbi:ABC transporter substrate-binding protein [Paenibacillus sp. FSL H8-0548]|uniref:extracellular solute-binding protein n=1 Tax=Paenibacillus sp. FSL H8-0548 TaxID=1920422 RepID=UPI00096C7DCB|nr:extracellular solute-binding protein [Paenibacillus sp. FSL H8-0548]OMF28084.1 ABC transporter substrate-binding protein [Paenibacillus sp. FSL H8-0548]